MSRKQEIIAEVADVIENLELVTVFLPDSKRPGLYADRLRDAAAEMMEAARRLEEFAESCQELQSAAQRV